MTSRHQDIHDPLLSLRSIIEVWPKAGHQKEVPSIPSSLSEHLATNFDTVDLRNSVEAVAVVKEVGASAHAATVYFYDTDGTLQRAELTVAEEGRWRLVSLKFQCPACFGTGTNDGDGCTICGGRGWGVS